MEKVRVLLLGANPQGADAQISREFRDLRARANISHPEGKFHFEQVTAVRFTDLRHHLIGVQPHVVHFSGHGNKRDEILLEHDDGEARPVSKADLHDLFSILKHDIRLVVLNSCFSLEHAKELTETIDCAVGCSHGIGEKLATEFSCTFYECLVADLDVASSLRLARLAIGMSANGDEGPMLLEKNGVDANHLFLSQRVSDAYFPGAESASRDVLDSGALKKYFDCLIERLDISPWHKDVSSGHVVNQTLSNLVVPQFVYEDTRSIQESNFAASLPTKEWLYEQPQLQTSRERKMWRREVLGEMRRCIVLGAPGAGKSVLSRVTVIKECEAGLTSIDNGLSPNNICLPIYMDLSVNSVHLSSDSPEDVLIRCCRDLGIAGRDEQWVRKRLGAENCIIVLDALDQVEESELDNVYRWLDSIEGRGWKSQIILTCRTASYAPQLLPWSDRYVVAIAPLEPDEVDKAIEFWFGPQSKRAYAIRKLLEGSLGIRHACKSPLVLSLLCAGYETRQLSPNARLSDIYRDVCIDLVSRCWQSRGRRSTKRQLDDRYRRIPSVDRIRSLHGQPVFK